MTGDERLRFIEGMLDMAPHTLTGTEKLRDLEAWDSLSTMLFIATVDKKFGVPLPGNRVTRCHLELLRIADDLLGVVDEYHETIAVFLLVEGRVLVDLPHEFALAHILLS
jgi:acyl carrier protein